MATWEIQETDSDRRVVRKGRTSIDVSDDDAALALVKKQRSPSDRVVRVDQDGYRRTITRRRWRARGTDL